MNIAIIGATGNIGSRILEEALNREHQVTAIARDPSKLKHQLHHLRIIEGDLNNPDHLIEELKGHDLVISAISPGHENPNLLTDQTKALINIVKKANVHRVIAVGGAGSLLVAPNVKLIDTPLFPAAWKGIAQAHIDALDLYLAENDLSWTNVSPAAFIEPGTRTGKFRTGEDHLISDKEGISKISMEDFAVAILDEAERPQFIRKRFTVGY